MPRCSLPPLRSGPLGRQRSAPLAEKQRAYLFTSPVRASVSSTNGTSFSGNPYCIGVYVENYGLFIKAITIE
jgi:hypothetical protein